MEKTNPGLHVGFFTELFRSVYGESVDIGTLANSDVLCEFDMLCGDVASAVTNKTWKHTFLFSGESTMKCNKDNYTCVLWGERNHKNVVNIPLFIPYLYTNQFVDSLQTTTLPEYTRKDVPPNDVCVFITNPLGNTRNRFLEKMETHFNVHYAGRYKNNIGGYVTHEYNTEEYIQFVKNYKFIISMENSREDTYITEKIVHGMMAKTVPVYWGSTHVHEYFNKNRFLCLEKECDDQDMDKVIAKMKLIASSDMLWTRMVNSSVFSTEDNTLSRTLAHIADDIKKVIHKKESPWSHISSIHCVCNPKFEPDRYSMLQNMFQDLSIQANCATYISPTYKHTITPEIYDKYTKNQLVLGMRQNVLKKGELSLFLNYKATLEHIVANYKDGLFMVFESDAMVSHDINRFNEFVGNIQEKDWDMIHCGMFHSGIYDIPTINGITGYRKNMQDWNPALVDYLDKNRSEDANYIEDITTPSDTFRLIRKFHTRCTDSYLWKYDAIVRFVTFMNTLTDYSAPFDYYMCNYLETNVDVKHYWSVNEFFKQGSNLNLCATTLQDDE